MTAPSSLSDVLKEHFASVDFDPHDPDLRAGAFPEWDSFAHFNLFLALEEIFKVRFTVEEMAKLQSVAELQEALQAKGASIARS